MEIAILTVGLVVSPFILMFVCLSINLNKATKLAQDKLKKLNLEEMQNVVNSSINGKEIIFAYFSKNKLSDIILVNLCKSKIKEINKENQ